MSDVDIRGDLYVSGTVIATGGLVAPDGSINNRSIQSGADIDHDKLEHLHPIRFRVPSGTTVASQSEIIHLARFAGNVVAVEVLPEVVPVGGTMKYTVDVQKSILPAAFASILSAVLTVDTSSVNLTPQAGIVTSGSLLDNYAIKLVVVASGSGGTQGTGLLVTIWVAESTV